MGPTPHGPPRGPTLEPPSIPVEPPAESAGAVAETGTTIVGLTAGSAVVLAADRRASLGGRFVTNKRTTKIEPVHPAAAMAFSGSVGHSQHFTRVLDAESRLYRDRRGTDLSIAALATLASNVLRGVPLHVVPLLGGVDEEGAQLFSLDPAGGRLEDAYVAGGSGMQLAYGVLERRYADDLALDAGRAVAARAVGSAAERDTASGDGLLLATVTADGVSLAEYDAVEEAV